MAEVLMTKDNGSGAKKKPTREFSTFRCYAEQGEKLNDLARLMPKEKGTIADVIEEHLDKELDKLLVRLTEERLKKLKEKR